MKRRVKLLSISLATVVVLAFSVPGERYFDIAKSLDIFATLFKEVNAYYVDDVDPRKLIGVGIRNDKNFGIITHLKIRCPSIPGILKKELWIVRLCFLDHDAR